MENQYEEEINLSAMLLSFCLRWRTVVIVMLVFGIVVGGTRLAMNIQGMRDPERVEQMKAEYEDALAAYQAEGVALKTQISENKRSLNLQTEYNKKSMLMQIDPRNECVASMSLYVDTNYQIMPGSSIQNENPAYKITCAYYDFYSSGEFFTTVKDKLSFDLGEMKYLKEVLNVTFDTSRYAIVINAVADTKEHCDELVRVAGDAFQSQYSFVNSSLGEHTLKNSDIASYTQINTDREAYQIEQKNQENIWLQNVPELNEQYREWEGKESSIERPIVDMHRAVRNGIKWIVIAGVIGLFGCAVLFFLKYLLSGKIREAGNLGPNACVLAELPNQRKKKNAIDRQICRLFGIVVRQSEYNSRVEAMALSLGKMLDARQCESKTVAFVGDVKSAELRELAEQTEKTLSGKYKIVAAGNMIVDPAAAKAAYSADAVVVVTKQNASPRKTYLQFCDKLAACKVQVLGTVLMGVEGL